ncbi:hypothetical protein LXL04_003206 [Taraxacum kok-saghyz]
MFDLTVYGRGVHQTAYAVRTAPNRTAKRGSKGLKVILKKIEVFVDLGYIRPKYDMIWPYVNDDHGFGPVNDDHGFGPVNDDHGFGPVNDDHGFGPVNDDHGFGPVNDDHGFGPRLGVNKDYDDLKGTCKMRRNLFIRGTSLEMIDDTRRIKGGIVDMMLLLVDDNDEKNYEGMNTIVKM